MFLVLCIKLGYRFKIISARKETHSLLKSFMYIVCIYGTSFLYCLELFSRVTRSVEEISVVIYLKRQSPVETMEL